MQILLSTEQVAWKVSFEDGALGSKTAGEESHLQGWNLPHTRHLVIQIDTWLILTSTPSDLPSRLNCLTLLLYPGLWTTSPDTVFYFLMSSSRRNLVLLICSGKRLSNSLEKKKSRKTQRNSCLLSHSQTLSAFQGSTQIHIFSFSYQR